MTVSIIIPVYKVSNYIESCIESVINQTYKNIECILVDDASPDDSIAKCERMIADYHGPIQFSIVHHLKNRGLSAARNTGTDVATGEYIYYLDSDDTMTDDCIEKLLSPVINDPSIEMVIGNYLRCTEGCTLGSSERLTLPLKNEDIDSHEDVRNHYFGTGIYQAAWNKLLKRDFLNEHHLRFKEGILWEDTLWIFYVVKYLNHYHTLPDVTYHYVKRPQAITTGMVKNKELLRSWCTVYNDIADHFTEEETIREVKYHWKGFCFRCIDAPNNLKFQVIAQKYKKALWEEHCLTDLFLMSLIVDLSRNEWSRNAFLKAANQTRNVKAKTTTMIKIAQQTLPWRKAA